MLYLLCGTLSPVGFTSISRLSNPDFASVIFTGLLVPININESKVALYLLLNFSLTTILSCETILFNFVLSAILLKSPSCCMAISGLLLKSSSANSLFVDANDFALNIA